MRTGLKPSPGLDKPALLSALESLLLVAGGPVRMQALATAMGVRPGEIPGLLQLVSTHLTGGIRLQIHGEEVQLVTAPENAEIVHRFFGTRRPPSVSRPALETLAIIAYRQPITRAEIEAVRGVNSDRAVQTLLSRGLIEERGRREGPGRPVEYGTTFAFLEYFGLSSIQELPPLPAGRDAPPESVQIGLRATGTNLY